MQEEKLVRVLITTSINKFTRRDWLITIHTGVIKKVLLSSCTRAFQKRRFYVNIFERVEIFFFFSINKRFDRHARDRKFSRSSTVNNDIILWPSTTYKHKYIENITSRTRGTLSKRTIIIVYNSYKTPISLKKRKVNC